MKSSTLSKRRSFSRLEKLRKPVSAIVGITIILLVLCILAFFFTVRLNTSPDTFPIETEFVIEQGTSAQEVMLRLKNAGYIQSEYLALVFLKTKFSDAFIHAESYTFVEPLTTYGVVESITSGSNLTPDMRAVFFEGFKTADLTAYLPTRFSNEDVSAFEQYEGFLFPDTYYIARDDTVEDIVERMHETYEVKTASLQSQIENSILTEEGIITFASILQREANSEETMRMVAGILWNRLTLGMPLQVDATFHYLLGKTSKQLTRADLGMDSPYNTYIHKGLPPTPIANPGLTAIEAVLDPIDSDYLFYLTGDDGNFYYAKTFNEHKRNKQLYIR